ncbi:hypothetical protein F53441_10824 [Fusarium austroafricanum]|uniref:Uncharacterized protein n=1 Tax=Fusarium austroafricanum TaxID=2364996 RepID=A0A8H4NU55_9HYPO|nr:hypothetical protein F53441_10824 [Fusarium austroafricanum]
MAIEVDTDNAPEDKSNGKVLILNALPGSGKTAIVKGLGGRLPGQNIRIVDSPIMAEPVCPHMYERRHRSAYLHEIRRSAEHGYTVLVTASLLNKIASQQVIDDVLLVICGKDIPLFWINIYWEEVAQEEPALASEWPSNGESKKANSVILPSTTKRNQLILPSSRRHDRDGFDLISQVINLGTGIEDAVKQVSDVIVQEHKGQ